MGVALCNAPNAEMMACLDGPHCPAVSKKITALSTHGSKAIL